MSLSKLRKKKRAAPVTPIEFVQKLQNTANLEITLKSMYLEEIDDIQNATGESVFVVRSN